MQVVIKDEIALADQKTVESKPDKNKDKTVLHRINSNTWMYGYPTNHPKYPEWLKRAQIQAKGQPLVFERNARRDV